jgi:hypothetical protein
MQKLYFSVNATLHWPNNVNGVYLVQVSLLLIGQQGLGHFFRDRPLLPIGWRLCKFYANAGGKQSIQRQPLLKEVGNEKEGGRKGGK